MIRTMFVHGGDHITRGQSIALISMEDSYSILTSTVEGTVISTKVDNQPFEAFEPIVSVVDGNESETGEAMLIAYVDNAGQRDLKVGMNAQVWPEDEKRERLPPPPFCTDSAYFLALLLFSVLAGIFCSGSMTIISIMVILPFSLRKAAMISMTGTFS